MSKFNFKTYILIPILCILTACTSVPDIAQHPFNTPESDIYVVEYSDEGKLYNTCGSGGKTSCNQKRIFLEDIKKRETHKNIVVFAHGWHHNAEENDDNLLMFRKLIEILNEDEKKYTGLYLGWRGDSSDVIFTDKTNFEPLDFYTIWARGSVAQKIGETGALELFNNLNTLQANGSINTITAIGHSLGTRIIFYSNKERMKENKGSSLYLLLNPALTSKEMRETALSDIPLFEGYPSIIAIQAKNDFAINWIYDAIKPGTDAFANSWALTHDLNTCPNKNTLCQRCLEGRIEGTALESDENCGFKKTDKFDPQSCLQVMSKGRWAISGRGDNGRRSPNCQDAFKLGMWVISADEAFNGHNGIFDEKPPESHLGQQMDAFKELIKGFPFNKKKDNP